MASFRSIAKFETDVSTGVILSRNNGKDHTVATKVHKFLCAVMLCITDQASLTEILIVNRVSDLQYIWLMSKDMQVRKLYGEGDR